MHLCFYETAIKKSITYLQCWYSHLRLSSSETRAGICWISEWALWRSWDNCWCLARSSCLATTKPWASAHAYYNSNLTGVADCSSTSILAILSIWLLICYSLWSFTAPIWACIICSSCCATASSCLKATWVAVSVWFSMISVCICMCCAATVVNILNYTFIDRRRTTMKL